MFSGVVWDVPPLTIQQMAKRAQKTGDASQFYISSQTQNIKLCVYPLKPSNLIEICPTLLATYRKLCPSFNDQMKRIDAEPCLLEFTQCIYCKTDLYENTKEEEKKILYEGEQFYVNIKNNEDTKNVAGDAYLLCEKCKLKWWSCSEVEEVDAMISQNGNTLTSYFFKKNKLQTFWIIEHVLLTTQKEYMGVVKFGERNSGWVSICLELFFSKSRFSLSCLQHAQQLDIKVNKEEEDKLHESISKSLFPTFDHEKLRAGIIDHYDYEKLRLAFESGIDCVQKKDLYMDIPRRYALQQILALVHQIICPKLLAKLTETLYSKSSSFITVEKEDVDTLEKIMKTKSVLSNDQLLHFFYPHHAVLPQMGGKLSQTQ